MSGPDAPNLGSSKDARELKIRQAAEGWALIHMAMEVSEEMRRLSERRERLLEEGFGLVFEAKDAWRDAELAEFAEKVLEDLESLDDTGSERREDGV